MYVLQYTNDATHNLSAFTFMTQVASAEDTFHKLENSLLTYCIGVLPEWNQSTN